MITAEIAARRVETLMGWDIEKPKTFLVSRQGIDLDYVERLEVEYKRYISLMVFHPNTSFPISVPVDSLWHAHLLFTRDYAELSSQIGYSMLHHTPTMTEEERDALEPHYFQGTLARYREHYGEPPKDLWPSDKGSICWSKGP